MSKKTIVLILTLLVVASALFYPVEELRTRCSDFVGGCLKEWSSFGGSAIGFTYPSELASVLRIALPGLLLAAAAYAIHVQRRHKDNN